MWMKAIWREILLSVVMAMILPGILINWPVGAEEISEETEFRPKEPQLTANRVRLTMKLRHSDGTVEEMDMDEYLVGVVVAEMPSTFEPEAKKAQAVAARTFARKAWVTGGKHGDGSVCDQSVCCQAYLTGEQYLEMGGSEKAIAEAKSAVEATSGYVLTYEGELIEATYFSCSGGSTEDAVAVWGTDYPYLRAVDSPGEEDAAHHTDTVSFTKVELGKKLGVLITGNWLGKSTYTAGGGVQTITIGGTIFTGKELRSLLGLRSTAFTLEEVGEEVRFTTRGFGHRVGLSQYGADAMAASGSGWREILNYYYQGTTLELTNAQE
jgi:stage II sporulation protein D